MNKKKIKLAYNWKKIICRNDRSLESSNLNQTEDILNAYENIERRQLTDLKNCTESQSLWGLYSNNFLQCSVSINDNKDDVSENITISNKLSKFNLSLDDGIFFNGFPFHHLSLAPLQPFHLSILLNNGIKISQKRFSQTEDAQILQNWQEYAKIHNLLDEDLMIYVSAAVSKENSTDRKARLDIIKRTNFRPWMCKNLLHRTCYQIIRRCYILVRKDRAWSSSDDDNLLSLAKKNNCSWEKIGCKLCRTRFACRRRYFYLIENKNSTNKTEWSNIETSRLYSL